MIQKPTTTSLLPENFWINSIRILNLSWLMLSRRSSKKWKRNFIAINFGQSPSYKSDIFSAFIKLRASTIDFISLQSVWWKFEKKWKRARRRRLNITSISRHHLFSLVKVNARALLLSLLPKTFANLIGFHLKLSFEFSRRLFWWRWLDAALCEYRVK